MICFWRRVAVLVSLLAAVAVLAVDEPSATATRRQAAQADALAKGLKVWRKPGAIDGHAACATCHSPDGIEIAAYNFDDADIKRRALPHLNEGDTAQLIQYLHALRDKLKLYPLRDPNLDRPLQPGGLVLPGNTPAERDLAFGLELQQKLPNLLGSPIETLAQAKAAERQLLRLDVTNLRVGIPLNRLSEDVAHGSEHASIAQWLPEVAPLIPQANQAEWYAAEDRYLADPSPTNLADLLNRHLQLVNAGRLGGLGLLSVVKYRALLVWQNRLRHHTESTNCNLAPDVPAVGYNPIWEVGETAREELGRSSAQLGMDAEEQVKKSGDLPMEDQLRSMRVSWFWAGWMSDQGQFKTQFDVKVRLGLWLAESLSTDGPYPIHNLFAQARRQAVISDDPAAWGERMDRRRRIWDLAGLRAFDVLTKEVPAAGEHRRMYIDFAANCIRMNLILLKDDIERTGIVWVRRTSRSSAKELITFIDREQPEASQAADKLEASLFAAISAAKVERY